MHRFFLPEDWITHNTIVITGDLVHRLRNVLRLGVGDHIIIIDNSGWEYEVELRGMHGEKVEGTVVSRDISVGEPTTTITLYQALLKGSSFELVLQKCTEIGVSSFVPIVCDRCVAGEPNSSRLDRWQKVILEAAQQSKRGKLPILHPVSHLKEACESVIGVSLLLWEREENRGFKNALSELVASELPRGINIFVGPEGGFSPGEVDFARSSGIMPVGMGRRIMRAETAGLVAATITLYELGDLDSNPETIRG